MLNPSARSIDCFLCRKITSFFGIVFLLFFLDIFSPMVFSESPLYQYWPLQEPVNLLVNGNFNRAVGGRPFAWKLEGNGNPYLFNRGAYHAAGVEVTDSTSPGARLVSQTIPVKDASGTWVLSGLFSGGPGQQDEVIPVDEQRKGAGVIEVRCYSSTGKRLPDATRFTFQGRRQGMHRYRELSEGRIFRRFQLPPETASVEVAWGLEKAVGRVTADDLMFYRDTFLPRTSLPVARYLPHHSGKWINCDSSESILTDGLRDPGPEGDINPVLAGVEKYPFNRNWLQSFPSGVTFDLGSLYAVDGLEITLAVSVPDVVDTRQERFEPSGLHVSFSEDGISFGQEIQLLYRPELMQGESLITLPYTGFRRLARYIRLRDSVVLSEVRFSGEKSSVLAGYRPLVTLVNKQLRYGVELELAAWEDKSLIARIPKGNIYRIDTRRSAEIILSSVYGTVNETVYFDDFQEGKILRRVCLPASLLPVRYGADLKVIYQEKVEVWDSPTTHSFKDERRVPVISITKALPALPELEKINQQLAAWGKRLAQSRSKESKSLAALASAQLSPQLKLLGVETEQIKEFFAGTKKQVTFGPCLLPEKEFLTPDGKYLFRVSRKAPDCFLIHKYEVATGRFISAEGNRGNYVTSGDVLFQQPAFLLEKRVLTAQETWEEAQEKTAGWEKVKNLQLEKGTRAIYRISFELPEEGTWTLAYKTLPEFLESKIVFQKRQLPVSFKGNQNVLQLPDCRKGRNELFLYSDASCFKPSAESKPFTTSFYHFLLLKTSLPVIPFSSNQCFCQGKDVFTVVYDGQPVTIKFPEEGKFQPAAIQFSSLLKPTRTTGIITSSKEGEYIDRKNQSFYVWGGHWNHVPAKETVDLAVRLLPTMGVNGIRQIYGSESEADQATGTWKPQALDNVFYQVAKFGEAGIYLDICLHSYGWYTDPDGAFYMLENGQDSRGRPVSRLWNPDYLKAQQNYARQLLTMVNPYTGRKLVDDPTLIAVEIANEDYGLGARGFDFESFAEPEKTLVRRRFNEFLLKKYKTREKLAQAWVLEPLQPEEDPEKGNIHFPPQFKTVAKSPNFFHQWKAEERIASPRVSDALEWCWSEVYTFIKTMHDFLRSLGVKCPISWCGFSTYEIQMTNLHPYLQICDSLGGSAYGCETNFRSLERWYKFGAFNHFWGKSSHIREWSSWNRGADVACSTNGLVAAGLFGLAYGLDHWSHHKLGYGAYPSLQQEAVNSINPDTDQRRAPFSFIAWAFQRAKIPVEPPRLLIGVPKAEACYGGLNSPCDTQPLKGGYSFLYDQVRMDYYLFDEVYDGPEDIVVFHEGRSPTGDYRKARHAILWSYGKTDPTGRNQKLKEDWFRMHGIEFQEGERWKKTDRVLAFNCDLVDEEQINQVLYDTLTEWGVTLPFSREQIHTLYATLDHSIEVNVQHGRMKIDRDDFQGWLGQNLGKQTSTSLLTVVSPDSQIQVLAIPFDTGSFRTAKKIALWSRTDATVTLKSSFSRQPEIWAVNWLGFRKYRVYPLVWGKNSVTISYQKDLDIHFYEILK